MLTVLISTYNGSERLAKSLNSYRNLEKPDGGWELIVIDNGSTDDTKQKILSFAQTLPLTYLYERERGKNVALNTGLKHMSGDLVAFSDDDVIPNRLWLKQMRYAADTLPAFSIFGGPIEPLWEVPPPEWILKWVNLSPAYAVLKPMDEGPMRANAAFGPNMAIRASVFEDGHRFDEGIGPRGTSYPQGSETELLLRLERLGHKAWHIPTATVQHMIRANQMSKKWVLKRAIRYGRGQYRLQMKDKVAAAPRILGVPRYFLRMLIVKGISVVRAKTLGGAEAAFREQWEFNFIAGLISEARRLARAEQVMTAGEE